MKTVFRKCLDSLDMGPGVQGSGYWQSWFYMFLTELDTRETAHPTSDVYVDKFRELLHRLRAYESVYAYQQVATLISSQIKDFHGRA